MTTSRSWVSGLRLKKVWSYSSKYASRLLQRSFKEFLDATVRQHRNYPNKKPKTKKDWFDAYKTWFFMEAAIAWDKAPVSLSTMEELTLARNCVQHGDASTNIGPKTGLVKMQSDGYHARFPDGFLLVSFRNCFGRAQKFLSLSESS